MLKVHRAEIVLVAVAYLLACFAAYALLTSHRYTCVALIALACVCIVAQSVIACRMRMRVYRRVTV